MDDGRLDADSMAALFQQKDAGQSGGQVGEDHRCAQGLDDWRSDLERVEELRDDE